MCAHKLAAQKVARYKLAWSRMKWPLFVTLTVRSTDDAFVGVRSLVEKFFAFRRGKWWKSCKIAGGIRGLELTHGAGGWHPHLHLLIDCEWLAIDTPKPAPGDSRQKVKLKLKAAQRELVRKWASHVGDIEAVVWVKRAKPGTEREVIKYSVKPSELVKLKSRAAEAIRAMEGTRACQCWGNCLGVVKELEALENKELVQCQCEGCQNARYMPTAVLIGGPGAVEKRHEAYLKASAKEIQEQSKAATQRVRDRIKAEPMIETLAKYEAAMTRKPAGRIYVMTPRRDPREAV